ncbi:hypothetical protein E2C01_062426 [Portunus trituberculatus]|uniref:Uncharacterized protein n=1 Tax=Portunus trituberculatus TaxID=210409 RepID=A0A5B7HH96_PORTR|nr:hypothetical protein [Portunus trituberculatus]
MRPSTEGVNLISTIYLSHIVSALQQWTLADCCRGSPTHQHHLNDTSTTPQRLPPTQQTSSNSSCEF